MLGGAGRKMRIVDLGMTGVTGVDAFCGSTMDLLYLGNGLQVKKIRVRRDQMVMISTTHLGPFHWA
jgi:hypothetical protein